MLTVVLPLQSNPFGAAKPINAEARLKELEEKISKEKVCKHFLSIALLPCEYSLIVDVLDNLVDHILAFSIVVTLSTSLDH